MNHFDKLQFERQYEIAALALSSIASRTRVIGYDQVAEILYDAARFSRPAQYSLESAASKQVIANWAVFQTGARHDELRSILTTTVRRLTFERVSPVVERKVSAIIETTLGVDEVEVCSQVVAPILHSVVSEIAGISLDRIPALQQATEIIDTIGMPGERSEVDKAIFMLCDAARESELTELIANEAVRLRVAIDEETILHNVAMLLFAFFGPLPAAIANTIFSLALNDEWPELDAVSINAWFMETMRLYSPTIAVDRIAVADCDIFAMKVALGEIIRCDIAAAHRDPAIFSNPTKFDWRRTDARDNLTFGRGSHCCIGTAVSRLICSAMIRHVIVMVGRVAPMRKCIEWHPMINAFGPKALHVCFVRRAAA